MKKLSRKTTQAALPVDTHAGEHFTVRKFNLAAECLNAKHTHPKLQL